MKENSSLLILIFEFFFQDSVVAVDPNIFQDFISICFSNVPEIFQKLFPRKRLEMPLTVRNFNYLALTTLMNAFKGITELEESIWSFEIIFEKNYRYFLHSTLCFTKNNSLPFSSTSSTSWNSNILLLLLSFVEFSIDITDQEMIVSLLTSLENIIPFVQPFLSLARKLLKVNSCKIFFKNWNWFSLSLFLKSH